MIIILLMPLNVLV